SNTSPSESVSATPRPCVTTSAPCAAPVHRPTGPRSAASSRRDLQLRAAHLAGRRAGQGGHLVVLLGPLRRGQQIGRSRTEFLLGRVADPGRAHALAPPL